MLKPCNYPMLIVSYTHSYRTVKERQAHAPLQKKESRKALKAHPLYTLFFLLYDCLFQPRKSLIAHDVFDLADICLCSLQINTCSNKLLDKKTPDVEVTPKS